MPVITEEMEGVLKAHGARFEYSGDAVVGPVAVTIAAGPQFDADGPSPTPFVLPANVAAWDTAIREAARALGVGIEGPGWLLLASAA